MENKIFNYSTAVKWVNGSNGILTEPTMPQIKVASPIDFENGVPETWTAEHLLISAANICLMTTFTAIAQNSKLNLIEYNSTIFGKMKKGENGFFLFTEIIISPNIVVNEEREIERASRLLNKAEKICPISNSLKSKIVINSKISVQ